MRSLYGNLKQAKKENETDKMDRIQELINEEKQLIAKQRDFDKDRKVKKALKQENVERAAQGKEAVFVKKREIKQVVLKQKFEALEKSGKTDRFMEKQHENWDKKRARLH